MAPVAPFSYRREMQMPASDDPPTSAAAALVRALVLRGVHHVFCVPGESFLSEAFAPVLAAARASGTVALIHVRTALADIAPNKTLSAGVR